jgi:hypothetical protein
MKHQLFTLHRYADPTGVSGTGSVAEGAQFSDGTVVIRWYGRYASTVIWSSLEDALAVHGHGGSTTVVWDQEETASG